MSLTVSAEIEVTPEMVRAGGQVIFENPSLCEDGWDELAELVYHAMEMARRKRQVEADERFVEIADIFLREAAQFASKD